ncbi:MAG: ATP-binding protein [Propionibacteriaceae bacterium]|nr:ATP-binding protein [Propionibacteriaceae bacterium]
MNTEKQNATSEEKTSTQQAHSSEQRFQVDLSGVIRLLSENLYTSEGVFIRELLQNSLDALTARQALDGMSLSRSVIISPYGVASIESGKEEFTITDSGIGVTMEEVDKALATVGASTKSGQIPEGPRDYIGQFGIGLLSCFVIADEVTVTSRSATGAPGIRWVGSVTGTYHVEAVSEAIPVGTTVSLKPRAESIGWARIEQVVSLVRKYGEFLPCHILVRSTTGDQVLSGDFPFKLFNSHREAIRHNLTPTLYGGIGIGEQLDAIEVSIPRTGTTGVIYISSRGHGSHAVRPNRVYSNSMLVTDNDSTLLPSWAFFAWAVIDSTGLNLTASRESLVEDVALLETRDALGKAVEKWMIDSAHSGDTLRFRVFLENHAMALKEIATNSTQLAGVLIPNIVMETTEGLMNISTIVQHSTTVAYCDSTKDFLRITKFTPKGRLVVNAGYVHDVEILHALPSVYPAVTIQKVRPAEEIDALASPSSSEAGEVVAFEIRAMKALKQQDTHVGVKVFPDHDLPCIYVFQQPKFNKNLDSPKNRCLYINWRNPVIQGLAVMSDDAVFSTIVQLLYVQARMFGQYDDDTDRALLTTALGDLITLAVGSQNIEPYQAEELS